MNLDLVKKIADAVLYEGYILYPYRASAVKNRQRFNWGVLTPPSYSQAQQGTERSGMQTEVLVLGDENTKIDLKIRFLHLCERRIYQVDEKTSELCPVEFLEVDGKIYQTWQEAVEREVNFTAELKTKLSEGQSFSFSPVETLESLSDTNKKNVGLVVRRQKAVKGKIEIQESRVGSRESKPLFKLTIRVSNATGFDDAKNKSRDEALAHSLVAAHLILSVKEGEFISLLEPPAELAEAAASCENIGVFPVLVGAEGERDCFLSSPIILYDYPEIAPESPGELFDGAEIDEILTLRILTMTDEEKREMLNIDNRARAILERSENLSAEEFMKMHGILRNSGKRGQAALSDL